MRLNILYILLIHICFHTVNSDNENIQVAPAPISPQTGRVIVNGSIQIRLLEPKSFKFCQVTLPNNKVYVNDAELPYNNKIILNENYTDQMSWLPVQCGIVLSDVSKFSSGSWILKAINDNFQFENRSSISIIDVPKSEIEIQASLASRAEIDCRAGSTTIPSFCRIFNKFGELISRRCIHGISELNMNDFGNWTCKFGLMGSLKEFTLTVMIKEKHEDTFMYAVHRTSTELSLSCSLLKGPSNIQWCRAVAPNGDQFFLSEGVVAEKYSSFGTNLREKKCGIEIKLPLQNSDNGVWRLDFGLPVAPNNPNDFTACFVSTNDSKKHNSLVKNSDVEIHNIMSGSSMNMECSVSWPIVYCYVLPPNGERHYSNKFVSENIERGGVCIVTINNVTSDMTGRWTCGVSGKDGKADILFYKEVKVFDEDIIAEKKIVQSQYGEDLHLLCKSPIRRPLRYCKFISPTGDGFLLQPVQMNSNSRLTYWGAFIENGECGVIVKDLKPDDMGIWTCVTLFYGSDNQYYKEISVEKPAISRAFTIGMSIGGAIVLISICALLIRRYRKKRLAQRRDENRSPSISSNEPIASQSGTVPMYVLSTPVHRRRSIESNNS